MPSASVVSASEQIRGEIARFIQVTQERSESDSQHQRRRARRRHQRSWPLLASAPSGTSMRDISVALHNASPLGIAFLSPVIIRDGCVVFLRLFWHEPDAPSVPAVVRHATPTEHGYLVGCEFTADDESLCQVALARGRPAEEVTESPVP
jgi:hypothetical protein